MDNSSNPFKQLVVMSPLIGAFLVFLGVLKLDIYYSYFKINIVDYLDFSEIITSFLDDINIILFSAILMILHTTIGSALVMKTYTKFINASRKRKISRTAVEKNLGIKQRSFWGVLLSLIVTGTSYWLLFYFQKNWIVYLAVLFSFQFIILILEFINKITIRISDENLYKPSIVMMLFLFTYVIAQLEITETKTHPNSTKIITNNETIVTNKDKIFIGMTKNYLFIHNKEDLSNQILRTDQLQKLIIENKK